jgi:TRAP-type C4-dicarboxylate transport system substrate-binding protein
MIRKTFIVGAVAVGAMLAANTVSTPADAGEKVRWNFSTWGKPRAFTKGIEAFREYAAKHSGGDFVVKVHYGGAISPPKENLDGLKIGAFEAANWCVSYHPDKTPVGGVLDLPFLPLENLKIQASVMEAFFQHPLWIADLKKWNVKPVFAALLPQYEAMGVGKPPRTLADWKGMRVRALGGMGVAMKKLGAVPTTMPAPETYTALERGVAQAITFPFSYTFGAYRLHEIGKWYTFGMALGSVNCPITANQQAYDKLPANYKKIVDEVSGFAYDAFIAAYREADQKWIPEYDKRMERITYTPKMRDALKKVGAQPVWDDWVAGVTKKGIPGQELLDFVFAEAKKAKKTM